jgi:predicted ATPase/DNA-binding SARP family transcriptional activator
VLEVAVLGPLSAARHGTPVPLGGARQREVLGVLLAAGGAAVTAGRIVQDVWSDEPESGSHTTLAAYVSRLRKLLPEAALTGSSRGAYALALPAGARDDQVAAQLLESARTAASSDQHAAALDECARALALYRGQPYAGLASPAVLRERIRLQELRCDLVEQAAAAQLALGRPEHAVAELEPLAQCDPPRAEALRLLALALSRSGQQPQALSVLRRGLRAADPAHRATLAQLEQALLTVPAQRLLDPPLAPLPLPLTSFVGRSADVAALGAALSEARLVTVVGSGGAGKTRLALELLRDLPRDDVAWVPLAALQEPALTAPAVQQAVAAPMGGEPRRAPRLVVIDNAEHVRAEVASSVLALLDRHPVTRVVVTSREPLGLAGERVVELCPLPPDGAAVQLFLDRAREVAPTWVCSEEELGAVRRICKRLDGLPLAIELAAAQCQALPPWALADALADRFALLARTADGPVPHHRTLDAAIAWSYDRLSEDLQRAFRALGVLAGSFDVDTARALLGAKAATVVADLAAQSLIVVDRGVRPRRYALLESLREFAASRTAAAERRELEDRHAAWACELAQTADVQVLTGDTGEWLSRLEHVLPDLQEAVRRDISHGRADRAVVTAGSLSWFFYRRRRPVEGSALLAAAVAAAPSSSARDRARHGLTHLLALQGDLPGALANAEELAREAQDNATSAGAQSSLGWILAMSGDLAAGAAHAAIGRAQAAATQDDVIMADAGIAAAHVAYLAGELTETAAMVTETHEHARRVGYSWAWTQAAWLAAKTSLRCGQTDRAAVEAASLVRTARAGGNAVLMLSAVLLIAVAALRAGRVGEAGRLLGAVTARAQDQLHEVDPVDGPSYAAEVLAAVDAAQLRRETVAGAAWDEDTMVDEALRLALSLSRGLVLA